MVYLFIGEDPLAKDLKLNKLKEELLSLGTREFDFDVLYGKETNLRLLQEKILTLPIKAKKRIILIKEAQHLKDDIREFVVGYAQDKRSPAILILDIAQVNRKDGFLGRISQYAQVSRFKDNVRLDTFTLSRQIGMRRMDYALATLSQLLEDGEKPERIIGGLRYAWEKNDSHCPQAKKKLKALVNCDIDIKTGRLRPDFALEKLVIKLCSLGRPQALT
jgi:DNA polymerase III delta subunit